MDYTDFKITVHEARGRQYQVSVHSDAGDGSAEIKLGARIEKYRDALGKAWIDRGLSRDMSGQPINGGNGGPQAAREFGRALFDAVLGGEMGKIYAASLDRARQREGGLRIKILARGPELISLPWELLLDPGKDDFLCLSNSTPIVRYLEAPHPPKRLEVNLPLRVLGMVASPKGLATLNVEREKALVERAVSGLREEGSLHIDWVKGETWRHLAEAVGNRGGGPWHILHFIGHGGVNPRTREAHITLATERGTRLELTAEHLGRLLGDTSDLRLVVLNACEGARSGGSDVLSSMAATLVRRGIPAVVAMQYKITDEAAIDFAEAFYKALVSGTPIDGAVSEARKVLSFAFPEALEWATPVLHMRSPDGRLFQLNKSSSQEGGIPATPAILAIPDKAAFGVVSRGDRPFIPVAVKNAKGGSLDWGYHQQGNRFFTAEKVGDVLGLTLEGDVRPGMHEGSVKILCGVSEITIPVSVHVTRWWEQLYSLFRR